MLVILHPVREWSQARDLIPLKITFTGNQFFTGLEIKHELIGMIQADVCGTAPESLKADCVLLTVLAFHFFRHSIFSHLPFIDTFCRLSCSASFTTDCVMFSGQNGFITGNLVQYLIRSPFPHQSRSAVCPVLISLEACRFLILTHTRWHSTPAPGRHATPLNS